MYVQKKKCIRAESNKGGRREKDDISSQTKILSTSTRVLKKQTSKWLIPHGFSEGRKIKPRFPSHSLPHIRSIVPLWYRMELMAVKKKSETISTLPFRVISVLLSFLPFVMLLREMGDNREGG